MSGSFDLHRDMNAAASTRAEAEASVPPVGTERAADGGPARQELSDREEQTARDASLDATRIEEIRERYARGAYDAPDVLEEVARRLLERGDV